MKLSRNNRKVRSAAQGVEVLENRCLLSATVAAQIPATTVTAGQTPAAINLNTYLTDPAITGGTVVQMQTPLGVIPLQLTDSQTPLTVANFVTYVNNGEYAPTIIQRSVPGFVLQGGGTKPDGTTNSSVASLQGEPGISNTTGTIAMALSSGPNSGTNQWFINLGNNTNLDDTSDGGPFTVFGNVIDGGMNVANAIAQLPTIDGGAENGNWSVPAGSATLPVINYTGSNTPATVPTANLVTDNIVVIPRAQAGGIYTAVSANPDLVTANVVNGVLTVAPASNTASGTTTVTATLTDVGGETAASTFTVNVVGLPFVTIGNASALVNSGNQMMFPVTLSAASGSATTFNYALAPGTAPSGDFAATGNSVTIAAGATQAFIPVNVLGDTSNAAEMFTITLSGLSGNATFPSSAATLAATGTILAAPVVTTIAIAPASPTAAFGGTDVLTATVTPASATAALTGAVTFEIAGTTVGSAPLSGDTAVLTATFPTAGAQAVTAVYSGDLNYAASTSANATVTVANPPALMPVVGKSTIPAAVVGGARVHGSTAVELTNATQAVEKGTATINLFASANGVIDDSSVLVTTLKHRVNLKTGKTATIHLNTKSLPSTLADGTYTLLVQTIDPLNATTNATAGSTITVAAPFVSLSATGAAVKPTMIKLGKSANLTLTLANAGNVATSGSAMINIGVSIDDQTEAFTLVDASKTLKIKANKSGVLHLHFVVPANAAAGTYNPFVSITDDGSTATAFGTTPITLTA